MERLSVTTPFGRRPISLALVKRQIKSLQIGSEKSVDKWKVHRDVCDARTILGLQDRALAILNALLSFYPQTELSGDKDLVVFPSNAQLTTRSNGIAGSTLRRSLAALVEAGLITRKDSPNGKRYARKGSQGKIDEAFGFCLAPLLARAEELAALAQQVAAERRLFKVAKERVSLCRRDIRKLISAAMEEGAAGDWERVESVYIETISRVGRSPTTEDLQSVAEDLTLLHAEIINILENQLIAEKMATNDGLFEQHIQNSNTESCNELEPRSEKEQGEKSEPSRMGERIEIHTFPLEMILRACPEIMPYGPGGAVANWRDLMAAAVTVRSMLGVSPSAYEEACEVMGQVAAASVMACIFERSNHITSAGGYLRDLTCRAKRSEFSLGPMIMALLRAAHQPARVA
jgi:replication initiation protein RepC